MRYGTQSNNQTINRSQLQWNSVEIKRANWKTLHLANWNKTKTMEKSPTRFPVKTNALHIENGQKYLRFWNFKFSNLRLWMRTFDWQIRNVEINLIHWFSPIFHLLAGKRWTKWNLMKMIEKEIGEIDQFIDRTKSLHCSISLAIFNRKKIKKSEQSSKFLKLNWNDIILI